jgi:hypothetical protein
MKHKGQIFEWLVIEVFVYGFTIVSHILLMVKSRFSSVGTDNSHQFEGTYTALLAKKIIQQIDLSMPDEFYADKERLIQIEGISIKVVLS